MWSDERMELRQNIITALKTGGCYVAVWLLLMLPIVKMFL